MKLSAYTTALLEDIERRIDPETEEDYYAQWQSFWDGGISERVFSPRRKKVEKPGIELIDVPINDAINDFELMLDFELAGLSRKLAGGTEALGIRANYGTGIMTSLFGAEIFEMPRSTNTLPSTKSFNDSDEIRRILDKGLPDLRGAFGGKVLTFGENCAEIFEKYPKIKKYVSAYHPDTQGPLDIAELLWGGEIFYEMYDDPDFVHSALRLITDTYKAFMDEWYSVFPRKDGLSVHWSILQRGSILLRLDSAMNLSVDFYNEFSKPYDSELLDYYGGGCMHFCGKGDHYIESMCEIENMYGFNMSQPHLNDMARIFAVAQKGDKKILSLPDGAELAERFDVRESIVHVCP